MTKQSCPVRLKFSFVCSLKNAEFLSKCIYAYTPIYTHIYNERLKQHLLCDDFCHFKNIKIHPQLQSVVFLLQRLQNYQTIIFNITNNSCHLLFSHKKVVPPKNIAQFKELCSIIKMFQVLHPFMRKKKQDWRLKSSLQQY